MKTLRALLTVLCLTFALSAKASTPVTVTINVPQMSWVDPGGAVVSPYIGPGLYMDASGALWNFAPGALAPAVTGYAGATPAALVYESYDCSGTARFNLNPNSGYFPGVALLTTTGAFYAVGSILPLTLHSAWYNNICNAYTNAAAPYVVYAATAITAPTLPTGPYHIELR